MNIENEESGRSPLSRSRGRNCAQKTRSAAGASPRTLTLGCFVLPTGIEPGLLRGVPHGHRVANDRIRGEALRKAGLVFGLSSV